MSWNLESAGSSEEENPTEETPWIYAEKYEALPETPAQRKAREGKVLIPDIDHEAVKEEEIQTREKIAALGRSVDSAYSFADLSRIFERQIKIPKEMIGKDERAGKPFALIRERLKQFENEADLIAEAALEKGTAGSSLLGELRKLSVALLPDLAGLQGKAFELTKAKHNIEDSLSRYVLKSGPDMFRAEDEIRIEAEKSSTIEELVPLAQEAYRLENKLLPRATLPDSLGKETMIRNFKGIVDAVRGYGAKPEPGTPAAREFEKTIESLLKKASFVMYADIRARGRELVISELGKVAEKLPQPLPAQKRRFPFA